MAKEAEYKATGWKSNKTFENFINNAPGHKEVAEYIKSPAFTEKDYIDVMAGMYSDLNPNNNWGWGSYNTVSNALENSPHNKLANNDKIIDFLYDSLRLKEDWNKKNPENQIDLSDHYTNINRTLQNRKFTSKKIHEIISDPKYMVKDRYSNKLKAPDYILENNNIKPEHLYKFLDSHPEHAASLLNHDKSNSHLESLILSNPENIKKLDSADLASFLNRKLVIEPSTQEGMPAKKTLNISPKIAKDIAENAHDSLYTEDFHRILGTMDPSEKKSFIDRKLGITGGKPAGLASWRTNDEQTNQESEGWNDWEHGPEYNPGLAARLADSAHLSDEQADHIKRHGNIDQKYKLYHNKHIDPKHGVEMFNMWHNNEETKGYSAEDLQDKYKIYKDNIYTLDDIDEDLIDTDSLGDSAREGAESSYPFSDWVSENSKKLKREIDLDSGDYDKISDALHEDHDWTGENPDHDKELHKLHQKILDNMEDGTIHIDKIAEITGKDPKDLQAHAFADYDGNISEDDLNEYMTDNNPEEIDFSNHDSFTIDDHPEYEDRFNDAADSIKLDKIDNDPYSLYDAYSEDYMGSDGYSEAYQEHMKEAKEEAAKEHYEELYSLSHQDDRFIPEHLHDHIPNIGEIRAKRKKATGEPIDFLDKHIPNRSYEHSYGEDQHLHEYLKDYADANGGSIDIGRMNKLMPNQVDTWKKIFGPKGKLTSGEIQGKIDSLQKTPYAISYGKWDEDGTQNLNRRKQIVFRLDHSDDSIKPLQEDPELFETFKKVQEVSKTSGHPTKNNTIAWARVDTTDPDHWMIDEVQSDFGKTVRTYLEDNNAKDKADHVQKISDHHKNWREAIINKVISEAKKHGASKVSTHSPESKASHTGSEKAHSVYQDSYKKVPRKMGFKPAKATDLPITDNVKENVFSKTDPVDTSRLAGEHKDAWDSHKTWASQYNALAAANPAVAGKASEIASHHESMAEQHRTRAMQYGIPHDDVSIFPIREHMPEEITNAEAFISEGGFKHSADIKLKEPAKKAVEAEYHEGHTYNLKPNVIKSMIDIVEDLIKFEVIFNNTKDTSIKKRAQVNINLIKNILGYEPDLDKWIKRAKIDSLKKNEQNNQPPRVSLNPDHGRTIANAYEQMKHDPNHPEVKAAYGALINETKNQFKDMLSKGFKLSKIQPNQKNPYNTSKDLHNDIEQNKHLWFFPTEQGFGSEGTAPTDHPMLQPTEFHHEGKPLLANDLFRIVHDYRGHYLGGKSTFGPKGEHQAYLTHKKEFSPLAQKALATETMGQNSTVNYGKNAEHNRLNRENTIYADQKAGLLPDNIINGRWHE